MGIYSIIYFDSFNNVVICVQAITSTNIFSEGHAILAMYFLRKLSYVGLHQTRAPPAGA